MVTCKHCKTEFMPQIANRRLSMDTCLRCLEIIGKVCCFCDCELSEGRFVKPSIYDGIESGKPGISRYKWKSMYMCTSCYKDDDKIIKFEDENCVLICTLKEEFEKYLKDNWVKLLQSYP